MQIFTHDEISPRESTLFIIRQIARSFRTFGSAHMVDPRCLN